MCDVLNVVLWLLFFDVCLFLVVCCLLFVVWFVRLFMYCLICLSVCCYVLVVGGSCVVC